MSSRDVMGRPLCQVEGCQEPARPWGYVFTIAFALDIRLIVCGRHRDELDRELVRE